MIWHINSKIKGCIDYEQVLRYATDVKFVEEYDVFDILRSFFDSNTQIFQFRLKYVFIYLFFFFSKKHFLDFRTLTISKIRAKRILSNLILYLVFRYFKRVIAEPTAFEQLKVKKKICFGLGAPMKSFRVKLDMDASLRFVFIGSIDRPGIANLAKLLHGSNDLKTTLDIYCSIKKDDETRIYELLKESFDAITFHSWIKYDSIHGICSQYDAGICYLDAEIYKTQVPLKIFDYASAGLYTLCNDTPAIRAFVPNELYVSNMRSLIELNHKEKKVDSPYDTWEVQVASLVSAICI